MPRKFKKDRKPKPTAGIVATGIFDQTPTLAPVQDLTDEERVFGRVVVRHGDLAVHQEQGDHGPLCVLRRGYRSQDGEVGHFVAILDVLPSAERLPAIDEAYRLQEEVHAALF